jgi:hypothetical protein
MPVLAKPFAALPDGVQSFANAFVSFFAPFSYFFAGAILTPRAGA